jgi:hypothetical protein
MSTMPSGTRDPEGEDLIHFGEQRRASREALCTATTRSDRHVHITFAHVTGFGKVKFATNSLGRKVANASGVSPSRNAQSSGCSH